jgi:hypothetical protein
VKSQPKSCVTSAAEGQCDTDACGAVEDQVEWHHSDAQTHSPRQTRRQQSRLLVQVVLQTLRQVMSSQVKSNQIVYKIGY